MMTIKKKGNPVLKQVAQKVPEGENVKELIEAMNLTMRHHGGIGIAANQVGELKRIIIIGNGGFNQEIINPVIIKRFGKKRINSEGCLSYPGKIVRVKRYQNIIVEGFNWNWEPIRRKLKGLNAYIVQHEVDHLNGITIG